MILYADFQLDGLFDLYRSGRIFSDLPLVQNFPDYTDTLNRYEKLIQDANREFGIVGGRQYYSRDIYFDPDKKFYCTYIWDIEEAVEYVKKGFIDDGNFPVERLYNNVDLSEIKSEDVELADPTIPIFAIDFDPIDRIFAIDGNKRIVRRVRDAGLNVTIPSYVFRPDAHLQIMAAPIFKTIYKIQHNLNVITNYKLGNISYCEFGGWNKYTSLYKI